MEQKGEGKNQVNSEKNIPRKTEFAMKQITIPIKGSYQKNEPPVKRLSDTKFRARLDKGLCFNCNEKYSSDYRCKVREKRELMLFILNKKESNREEASSKGMAEEVIELNQLDLAKKTKIELRTITDFTSKGTMKLRGNVKGKEVVVLIDSGAINNFINVTLVEERQLGIEP